MRLLLAPSGAEAGREWSSRVPVERQWQCEIPDCRWSEVVQLTLPVELWKTSSQKGKCNLTQSGRKSHCASSWRRKAAVRAGEFNFFFFHKWKTSGNSTALGCLGPTNNNSFYNTNLFSSLRPAGTNVCSVAPSKIQLSFCFCPAGSGEMISSRIFCYAFHCLCAPLWGFFYSPSNNMCVN